MLNLRLFALISCLLLFFSGSLFAEEKSDKSAAMMEMLKGVKIDKKQVAGMLDMMAAQGKITKAQAEEAKKKLATSSEGDMEKLKNRAVQQVEKGASGENLNSDQKKLLDEVTKRITPGASN